MTSFRDFFPGPPPDRRFQDRRIQASGADLCLRLNRCRQPYLRICQVCTQKNMSRLLEKYKNRSEDYY